jgi:hypothetical protein
MTEKIIVLSICGAGAIAGFWLIGYGIWCMIRDSRKNKI